MNREQANPPANPKAGIAATLSNLSGATGTSAPSTTASAQGLVRPHTKLLALLAISLIALLATTASASAAPLGAKAPAVSTVSYTSAHATGKISSPAEGLGGFTEYRFWSSTDQTNWTPGPGGSFGGVFTPIDPFADKEVEGDIAALTSGTQYFVRLTVANNGNEAESPAPNPSFTTLTADPPTILGPVAASGVFSTSATATGEVNRPAASDDVNCRFEYITDAQFQENITNVGPDAGFDGATPIDCVPNPIAEAGAKAVKADLAGLNPATTYHLRLLADNAAPGVVTKDAPNFTTAAKVAAPSVIKVNSASDLGYRTATLSGEVERPAGADPALDITSCRFEYVTDEQFTNSEFAETTPAGCDQTAGGPIGSEGPNAVTASLTGLKSGVTYHYRLAAENSSGTDTKEAAATFTTTPGGDPTFTFDSDPIAGPTTVRLTGTVTSGIGFDSPVTYAIFQVAEAGGEFSGGNGSNVKIEAGPGPQSFSYDYTGLNPDTAYEFRMYVEQRDADDTVITEFNPVPNPTATTGHLESPTASCDPVTDFTASAANFSCTVDTHAPAGPLNALEKEAYKTEWELQCTPECKDGNENPIAGTVEGEEGSKAISGDATRLEPNTHYEVKLVAHNELYSVETPAQEFDTDKTPPSVKHTAGAPDGTGGYTLQGVVNPNNEDVTDCEFRWGPKSNELVFGEDCSPLLPNPGVKPTTVEAHLTGLTPDVDYYSQLVVKYGTGLEEDSGDPQAFKATLAAKQPCPANEQQRTESNSLALPECRAYELVTPMGKEGFGASLETYDGGERVAYVSQASNIAKSGQGAGVLNFYVAARTADGWETIPDLNGSSGSLRDAPSYVDDLNFLLVKAIAYSPDLLTSIWALHRKGEPAGGGHLHFRDVDGTFTSIGSMAGGSNTIDVTPSADLSHVVSRRASEWGPGIYEYVGTGNAQPRRVDVDNSGAPISTCNPGGNAQTRSLSSDGTRVFLRVFGGCGAGNPPAGQIWARVNGTTSFDVSASHCNRAAADPGGLCNGPTEPAGCVEAFNPATADIEGPGCRTAKFAGATPDGSRVFFTTNQQLVNEDVDQTNDIYACDLPSGNPAPGAGKANPCAAFMQVSAGEPTGAIVESVGTTSENGATVLFTAKGVLSENEDALKEKAVPGDHNLYVWRADASHPDGRTSFVGRLYTDDLDSGVQGPQATPDGRYLVFTTASQLLDTDTDNARDVYRLDAETGGLTRVSTSVFGVGGNGSFDAAIQNQREPREGAPSRLVHPAISDDGTKLVFTTTEALSPADGNAEADVYLWTPARVSLISTGSSGSAPRDLGGGLLSLRAAINPSGADVYFESAQQLTPADGDNSTDVYDARIGGGFSFPEPEICLGEKCQPDPTSPSPNPPSPANTPNGDGNFKAPKPCPKGKVRKKNGKCVPKHKKHHKKKGKGKTHRAGSNSGGNK